MKNIAIACLAVGILASAGSVAAQDHRITIRDLNLSSSQGAERFDARVRAAANQACRMSGSRIPDARCIARFQEEAVRRLPSIMREDYARARGGRVLAQVPLIYG